MKKTYLYIAGLALTILGAACSEEQLNAGGEGELVLSASVSTDMELVSRTVEQDLIDNCMVWISNEKGLIRRYDRFSDVPTTPIGLIAGSYVAEAWTGDSVPASFDSRWFKGYEKFEIAAGQTAKVNLECKIANVGATVSYAEGIEDVLSDFTMTIGHKGGSLVFNGREERRGYFMMPSFDPDLAFELKGTQIDGSEFVYSGVIKDAKPATEYAIKVDYTPVTNEVGGAVFSIIIDEHEIEVHTDVEIICAPVFEGYGFDLSAPVIGEKGTIGRRTVYVTSATKISTVELRSDIFATLIPALGGNNFEILGMNEQGRKAVESAGINCKYCYDEANDATLMQINFEEDFTNNLENGEYAIEFEATDVKGKSSTATLNIVVSDATVMTEPMPEEAIGHRSATLYGTVAKDGVETVGFNYRLAGTDDWTSVEGTPVSRSLAAGTAYTATITGLTDGATYEYVATAGDYVSTVIQRFTTLRCIQLPNAGFEDWFTYKSKIEIPGTDYTNNFWDSGNHGSTTVGGNITTKSSNYKHSGEYSACLKSAYVVIKFAAGNIFAGKYLATSGTNGVLGWGRPFTAKPKSVKIWVRYEPEIVNRAPGEHLKKGDSDQGAIYMALVDDSKQSYNNEQWPCVIKTASSAKDSQLFDKDGANVIAYGEKFFLEAVGDGGTNGMVQIEIPLDYKSNKTPSNIIFVASASRYGDYFEGAEDSTMYIDDIELIYE